MVTFFVSVFLLFIGYIFYSKAAEKIFSPDSRLTPALKLADGVDYTPLPKWKSFLIELLNIAGTGPIFGAVSGALFGPIVYVWIVFGCILGGAVHDYYTGMISSRNAGGSIVILAEKYLGRVMKIIMTLFSVLLLVLVTAVFVVSPSSLLESLTGGRVHAAVFMAFILAYYLLATLLPIDKLIGKAYPVFGIILIVMAVSVIGGILFRQDVYFLPELVGHFKDYSKANGGLPWWPFMFTTVACGAMSGFHATQSPMIAKCIQNEKQGRYVFYGAMVAEGVIALIWAAAAIAFFRVGTTDGWQLLNNCGGGNSSTVYEISKGVLGPLGSVLAVVGVVICPVTSGDTALRSCRLILGEIFHINQKPIKKRLLLTLPLFCVIAAISVWNFIDSDNFNILWRWFAWSNQTLAVVALSVCTVYLVKKCKYRYGSLITALPAAFMCSVVVTYFFGEPNIALGKFIPLPVAVGIGAFAGVLLLAVYFVMLFKNLKNK